MFEPNNPQTENNFSGERAAYENTMASGAHWFYWIAGLSLVTALIQFFGGNFSFAMGLTIPQVVEGVAQGVAGDAAGEVGGAVRVAGLLFEIIFIALFAIFGYFASRGSVAVFIIGMLIYALDGAIFVLLGNITGNILGIIIHVLALYYLFTGLMAAINLNKLRRG